MSNASASEYARAHGYDAPRMPWFGVFLAQIDNDGARSVTIASRYRDYASIEIALSDAMRLWPKEVIRVRWFHSPQVVAGFVPAS